MGRLYKEQEINARLRGKVHLLPVFHSVYDIPDRLHEYDPALFLVFNRQTQQYEVHSLNHKIDTFALVAMDLDCRLIERVKRMDLYRRGNVIFREIEEHNRKLRESRDRDRRNQVRRAVDELKGPLSKLAWEGI